MACYKLSSCTAGNPTVLWSNDPGFAGNVGQVISLTPYSGICFYVELIEDPCPCQPNSPNVQANQASQCVCTSPYQCYKLQDCQNPQGPYIYVTGQLNPYIGLTVSVPEFPGHCYNVIGVTDAMECDTNTPTPVTCIQLCTCNQYCYELTNCLANPPVIIQANSTLLLTLNNVISPTPSIIPPGGNNCWTVTGVGIQPCNPSFGTTITAVVDYGPNGCQACAGPPPCFQLTSCDGLTTVYTQSALGPYAGGPPIATTVFPGQCWIVTQVQQGGNCPNPVVIDPLGITYCTCPCYTLTNCRTNEVINSNSNLAAYVGQSVHLNEYGGCQGDCWLVAANPPPGRCDFPVTVTVSTGCQPCGPCGETCYDLIDCETDVLFATVLNPTLNAVDLSTLISGQSIGQIDINGVITNGCWYVQLAESCTAAVQASVFNIYQPTPTQDGCEQCLNSCYGLLNCKTLTIDYVIKYTVPNPYSLPHPSTLTGAIGSLCFEAPTGCVPGCYQLQLIPDVDCAGSVDWSTVVSYTPYQDCFDCEPPCYLLTECAPAVSTPFVVNNDLSLYVGNIAKICDSNGVCHCYHVEIAQSCDGAITIDNANAAFITCEECNSCDCPPGYTKIGDNCQKITTVPATANPVIYSTGPGSINALYGSLGTNFYANITSLPYPLTAVTGPDRFQDAAAVNVPFVNNITGVWGGPAGSRLNTIGIWTTAAPNPVDEWIGFAECINIPADGVYCIGIGGDDHVRMKIDGVLVASVSIGFFGFRYWHIFEINLTAGIHVITLEGKNLGGAAAFAAEIYNATSAVLQTYTTVTQVQLVTIFSTFPKRTSGTFQTGQTSGYSCPPGYTLNTCNGAPVCSLIETIPYVPCAPTYLVTDCAGIQAPFITNTDLSGYIGGQSYKTCITNPTYTSGCYLLKDCNRLASDIYTTTNMGAYLWQSVALVGYPGSCFMVLALPSDFICMVNPVTIDDTPCSCAGAQVPWPDGCYCVTVEEIPPVPAPDFIGVFQTAFACCEECLLVCYLLTPCQENIIPVIVCNDLADYVGQVIKIEGCGDICWTVSIAASCVRPVTFAGAITAFEDCPTCLPPVPEPPPPYELHLRKIKPGYNSPNSCYTTTYVEKVNCSFAEQVYNAMLVKRYGITACCEEDLTMWDIRKQLMDLDILKDPRLCKSTLCYCPAPCLIDVEFALLPFCADPNIISVVLDLPCPAPVVTGVVIEVPPIAAPCYCFTVQTLQPLVTIMYMNCCCETIVQVIEAPGNYPFCAATAPVAPTDPGAIIVTNAGACDAVGPCNPPTCYCWKVTNEASIGSPDGSAEFDNCCMGPFCPTVWAAVPAQQSIYNCAFNAPVVSGGNMLVQNMGPCGTYCGPTPPVCQCYSIELIDGGTPGECQFAYVDCNGASQFILVHTGETVYICSQILPNPACVQTITYNVTPLAQTCDPAGHCDPPTPLCNCYEVRISGVPLYHNYTYIDCNTGDSVVVSNLPGIYQLCARSVTALNDPLVTITLVSPNCAPDCATQNCVCYDLLVNPPDGLPIVIFFSDCYGQNVITSKGPGSYKLCSQIVPYAMAPGLTVTATPLDCGSECV